LREVDAEVMRTGQPRTADERLTIAGTPRFFLATKVPYRNSAGDVIGVIGISRDITERKRAEKVRENEERQRLAAEAANLGIWCWNLKNGRLLWTPLCRSLHGLGEDDEVTFVRFIAMLHPDDRERTERAVRRSLEERGEYRIEHRVVWPDGSIHWIRVLGRVFCDPTGEPDRMLGASLDITAQKAAEQALADALLREQAARAEAQAATRAKDEFLAVVSHELRTPLQSILGWTQMLKARRFDEGTLQRVVETIERNGKAQARLIEDLLDVSRIVAGKLRLERKRVDLVHVVTSALESAKAAIDAKAIQVDVTIEPVASEVLGDPDRLQQVVANLLSNAVKFTPSLGRIGVRLEREGTAAKLTVENTGVGISPEFLPHIFDRFRQAASVTRRAQGGLGLGLAIVRHLVELHGGAVKAESPGEGQGATLTVTLPLDSTERRAVAAETRKAPRNGPSMPVGLEGVRVLVVDDDPDARALLEMVLHESGAEVHAVPSVCAALDELESFRPHLLLSDIGMPEEDGYTLIRKVRTRESAEGGHIPAIALTAFASQADREQALALGFEAHIAKPASPGDLATMMASLLGRAA
jgi:PAS domain S-box-containing protein